MAKTNTQTPGTAKKAANSRVASAGAGAGKGAADIQKASTTQGEGAEQASPAPGVGEAAVGSSGAVQDSQATLAAEEHVGGEQHDSSAAAGDATAASDGAPASDLTLDNAVEPVQASATPVDGAESSGLGTAMWEVLTPFKFRGCIVKPPAWLELHEDDAAVYQAAGVLGTEPGEVPSVDAE